MLLETPFGSHLYGLATPESDRDYKGIFMPTAKEILLGTIPKTRHRASGPDHVKNTLNDVDSEVYSLHYFVKLAMQGQTVALDLLHGDQETVTSPEWKFLKQHRHKFYTKSMKSFIGYARKQAAKYGIKGSRLEAVREALAFLITCGDTTIGELYDKGALWHSKHTCIRSTLEDTYLSREHSYWEVCGKKMTFGGKASHYVPMLKQYYEQYGKRAILAANNEGVDWKAVSHALRVGYQTLAIFTVGTYTYPLPETAFLLDVKTGNVHYKDAAHALDRLITEVEQEAADSGLPDRPDASFWEPWLEAVTLRHIKGEHNLVEDPMLGY